MKGTSLRAPALGLLAAGAILPLLGHPGVACPLRTMTGIPCPLCGMSTSVEATVRGRFSDAFAANPMGIAVVAVAIALTVGIRMRTRPLPRWTAGAALMGMWIFQLFRFSIV